MSDTPAATEPLWTLAMVEAWLAEYAEHATPIETQVATVLASDIVYDYEAKLDEYQVVFEHYVEQAIEMEQICDAYEAEREQLRSDNDMLFQRAATQVAELVEKQQYILELEQEQTALWHSLNTMSEYVETLEAQLAERELIPGNWVICYRPDALPPSVYNLDDFAGTPWIPEWEDGGYEFKEIEIRLCRRAIPANAEQEVDDAN